MAKCAGNASGHCEDSDAGRGLTSIMFGAFLEEVAFSYGCCASLRQLTPGQIVSPAMLADMTVVVARLSGQSRFLKTFS